MKWNVKWKAEAERQLGEMWLDAKQRDRITAAAYQLDEMLEADAENIGESRFDNRRIVFVPPLGAMFAVYPAFRVALVLTVWKIKDA